MCERAPLSLSLLCLSAALSSVCRRARAPLLLSALFSASSRRALSLSLSTGDSRRASRCSALPRPHPRASRVPPSLRELGRNEAQANLDVRHIVVPAVWQSLPETVADVIGLYGRVVDAGATSAASADAAAPPKPRVIVFCETKVRRSSEEVDVMILHQVR